MTTLDDHNYRPMGKPNGASWAWVGGWIYLLPQSWLDDAKENGVTWIRPATDDEVRALLGKVP